MTQQFPGGDTSPWYKQFWPWFIFMLPASVVVAGLTTVVIANRHADDLVVDDYYKNGLAINRQLEKKQAAELLGISASFNFQPGAVIVHIEGPVTAPNLRLRLSHPLEADRDFSVELSQLSTGVYHGQLAAEVAKRWHWILEGATANGPWRLDGSIHSVDLAGGGI